MGACSSSLAEEQPSQYAPPQQQQGRRYCAGGPHMPQSSAPQRAPQPSYQPQPPQQQSYTTVAAGYPVPAPPMAQAQSQPAMQLMSVSVPQGMQGGMPMQVQTPGGLMQVQIPPGLQPGAAFQIQVPLQAAQPAMAQPAAMAQPGYPQAQPAPPAYPQPGYDGYPQPSYPQPGHPQPGYPQPASPADLQTPQAAVVAQGYVVTGSPPVAAAAAPMYSEATSGAGGYPVASGYPAAQVCGVPTVQPNPPHMPTTSSPQLICSPARAHAQHDHHAALYTLAPALVLSRSARPPVPWVVRAAVPQSYSKPFIRPLVCPGRRQSRRPGCKCARRVSSHGRSTRALPSCSPAGFRSASRLGCCVRLSYRCVRRHVFAQPNQMA